MTVGAVKEVMMTYDDDDGDGVCGVLVKVSEIYDSTSARPSSRSFSVLEEGSFHMVGEA